MRPLILLLLAAAPLRAETVCYYNHRERIVKPADAYCEKDKLVVSSAGSMVPSCGVSNVLTRFTGDACDKPCESALKGIKSYRKKGKTVIFGPALLPLDAASKWAFAEYEGSCYELREALNNGRKPELSPISDDDLIKAGADSK